MTDQQWREAWDLYGQADSLASEQLLPFLADATSDAEVRKAVEQLLLEIGEKTPHRKRAEMREAQSQRTPELPERIGRYTVTECLGGGGMGTVYSARDSELDRLVAIKFLSHGLGDGSIERSTAEARAASTLNHPNIVTIYDVIRLPSRIAIVMELVEGTSLRHLAGTPLPLDRVLHIGEQIGRALRAVHERGIVHCDIKPENLMLRPDGLVKILDFGLARDASLLSSQSHLHTELCATWPLNDRSANHPQARATYSPWASCCTN